MAKKQAKPTIEFNDRLILFRYFLNLFGKKTLKSLAGTLNSSDYDGYDENQNTYYYGYFKMLCKDTGISPDLLRRYDENICRYVKQIGENRGGISLKYYQYVALLFTEMYLDNYFSDRKAFMKKLNDYIDLIAAETLGANSFDHYTEDTMNKLAFMCATGSGKTLIMHINILQYMHYMKRAKRLNSNIGINKIIVLTPNEGLSNQHLEELKLSNIPATLFSKDLSGFNSRKDEVIIIDINKLEEEGKVKTVSVDSFEQNNLVLVDEGHKGLTGDVWYDYRTRLSADGFSFEYSATFKQALRSQKAKDMEKLLNEYGKAIIMDYSYKYFYEDGYGKDYRIYNLKETVNAEQKELYLVGCMISFYQQMKLFEAFKKEFQPFNIEKPLLVFVGNRVTASVSSAELTDVEEVLAFIDRFVKEKAETIRKINAIIKQDTGLIDGAGNELFYNDFSALIDLYGGELSADDVFADILRIIFNVDSVPDEPRLHVVNLKQVDGEIGLKIGEHNDYFGVISVGDTATLTKKCESDRLVTDTEEFISDSMFKTINDKGSKTNVLIGSRKFSEGWNSWRVSTMGLINFAKGEGSQAIQLFGRGVRLKGYEGCLKRSDRVDTKIKIPRSIYPLETLTIFGVKAQYMEDFKKFLELEDVGTNETVHEFKIYTLSRFPTIKDKGLQVIALPKDKVFKKNAGRVILDVPDDLFMTYLLKNKIIVDCRSKIQTIESSSTLHIESTTEEHTIAAKYLAFLDYDRIYNELEQYKNEKFYYNIILDKSRLMPIMKTDGWYSLVIPETHLIINSVLKLQNATDFAVMVLKLYLDKFFTFEKERWEEPYMAYHTIKADDPNFVDEYTIRYSTNDADADRASQAIGKFVEDIKKALDNDGEIKGFEITTHHDVLTAFDFPKHLYAPLISVQSGSLKIQVSPVSMNTGEKRFVELLSDYTKQNASVFEGKEMYLLRNKSKSGMGFFEAGNFYPDFVLWIIEDGIQRISFIDPKGLMKLKPNDPKITFYKKIKEKQVRLASQENLNDQIILNSFIMSVTPSLSLKEYWNMSKGEREAKNIYCLDNEDCIEKMIDKILTDDGQV